MKLIHKARHIRHRSMAWALLVMLQAPLLCQADPVPEGGVLTTGYGYDAEGRLTTVNLPKDVSGQIPARKETHSYDSLGRRMGSELARPAPSASAPTLGFGYDGLDQLKSVKDPRALSTTYTTNGLGNTTRMSSPDSGTTPVGGDSTFYPDGLLNTRKDARGNLFTYSYDNLGRLTSVSYASGTASVFEYDIDHSDANNTNSVGHLSRLTDESGTTTYLHDGLGRVKQKTQTDTGAPAPFVLKQTWSDTSADHSAGKLKNQTYPSLARVNYTYDSGGRIQTVTLNRVKSDGTGTSNNTITLLDSIEYTGLNQLKKWTWGSGVFYKSRTFDEFGRVTGYPLGNANVTPVSGVAGIMRTVNYDDAGRIASYKHKDSVGANQVAYDQTFTSDGLDRLTQQQMLASSYAYDYDLTGNRIKQTIGGTQYSNIIDQQSNWQQSRSDPSGTTSYYRDDAGNLRSRNNNVTYTHSTRGRLASIVSSAGTVNYLYNALGQRVAKSGSLALVTGGARYFVHDEQGHVIGEYDASGNPVYEVVYVGDTPVAVITQTRTGSGGNLSITTNISYVYADHLNTPRLIANSSTHAVQWRWDQDEAYGNSPPNNNPYGFGAFEFNLRFPGQVYDAESALFYNHHRYYDPANGRYVESDPIGLEGGINPYAYVENNSLSFVDPLGLAKLTCVIPFGGCTRTPDPPTPYPDLPPYARPPGGSSTWTTPSTPSPRPDAAPRPSSAANSPQCPEECPLFDAKMIVGSPGTVEIGSNGNVGVGVEVVCRYRCPSDGYIKTIIHPIPAFMSDQFLNGSQTPIKWCAQTAIR